ncbi:M24 family metallopeptidase [Nevskia soli]|uniref:M24 family metallopeptidase n=1 Tax=Nevskia soli TaxID=418856 RepID=UPI0015D73095
MNVTSIQDQLIDQELDGWLFFDHHHRDPLAYRVLGLDPNLHASRRWYYFVPAKGEPRKLVHRIESRNLDTLQGAKHVYSSWEEQTSALSELLAGSKRVAMQYSPNCAIPYVSNVDGGTLELVRSTGVEVVSSAELIQHFEARLDSAALDSHLEAGVLVDQVRRSAFQFIGHALRANRSVTEWDVAAFVLEAFEREGLLTEHGPIVGVNEHAGDPHYEPSPTASTPIAMGDFVLLDLWAKFQRRGAIFYDVTWTAFCGDNPLSEMTKVFGIVRDARNAAVDRVKTAFENGEKLYGFQVDDAARTLIRNAGYGDEFVHRTGHSIGMDIHGSGANMDNLETHDIRRVLPWSCFSIEPGIYLDNFGVRSEINMFIDATTPRVTGEQQQSLVLIS